MNFKYSTITRTLTVFGAKMTHIFSNVGVGEIEELVTNAKFKAANWRGWWNLIMLSLSSARTGAKNKI
ncbi:hypothetical protein [Acinetobacter sp. TSRC1-2]|uniref:hypothetical protein n=1 Tax=unclassified Acinetobacter TaxID=196816 RepID=UPI003CF538DD